MMCLLIIPYMALMSVWAGGSLWPAQYLPKRLTWLPEAFFALGIAFPVYLHFGLYAVIALAWALIFMNSGTWTFLQRKHNNPSTKRKGTLKFIADYYGKLYGVLLGKEGYSWIAASVKGFLITLPIGGLGAIYWPLSYKVGWHTHTRYAELLSGAFTGLNIYIIWAVLNG